MTSRSLDPIVSTVRRSAASPSSVAAPKAPIADPGALTIRSARKTSVRCIDSQVAPAMWGVTIALAGCVLA